MFVWTDKIEFETSIFMIITISNLNIFVCLESLFSIENFRFNFVNLIFISVNSLHKSTNGFMLNFFGF